MLIINIKYNLIIKIITWMRNNDKQTYYNVCFKSVKL
jgi:hypothetical protein